MAKETSTFLTSHRFEPSQLTSYILGTALVAIVTHVIIKIIQQIRNRRRDTKALKDFPGPPGHWLLGNVWEFIKAKDVMDYATTVCMKYAGGCMLRISPFIVQLRLHHPDTIKALTSTSEPKDEMGYHFLTQWLGDGLLISRGRKWARHRRLLTPAFNFDILKPYVSIFSESANRMVEKWKNIANGETKSVEVFEHVSLMTLDSLMQCIFGFKGDIQKEGFEHPYIRGVYELAELTVARFRYFPHHNDFIYSLSRNGFRWRRACHLVHSYSQQVIKQRKIERAQQKGAVQEDKPFLDFMDMLLMAKDEEGQGLNDEDIQAEVDTFMFEGHDTTASGISWCLYNLARHPEYQKRCRDEVNCVLGDRDNFSWDDMHKLPFLSMCVKESLRIHPPVPAVGRQTTKPLTFPDGRTIPEGIMVAISIYGCHHNPDVWQNPDVYDPFRFSPENIKNQSSHAFIPFSAGSRNCIGQHFALHEIKSSVGMILRHFELIEEAHREVIKLPFLVLRCKDGLHITVKAIEQ